MVARPGPTQLVDAVDDGCLGRVEVEPDDVIDLVHKQRVIGQWSVTGFPDRSLLGLVLVTCIVRLLG